jgi:hypothetical protein
VFLEKPTGLLRYVKLPTPTKKKLFRFFWGWKPLVGAKRKFDKKK